MARRGKLASLQLLLLLLLLPLGGPVWLLLVC
jgi:hypothetical protein